MPQQSHPISRASTTEKAPDFHVKSQKPAGHWQKLTAKKRKPPSFRKQRGRPAVSPYGEGAASGVLQECTCSAGESRVTPSVEGVASGGKKKKTAGASPTASERQLALFSDRSLQFDDWFRARVFRRASLQWFSAVLCVDCLQWPCACSFEDDGGGL